jgi:hypothetical protein
MKRFALKTKQGEVINTISAENQTMAAELFANIKKLSVDDLLNIYDVDIFIR